MKNIFTFAKAKPLLLHFRSAFGTLIQYNFINDNTPPMPLQVRLNAHLGGLFFLGV